MVIDIAEMVLAALKLADEAGLWSVGAHLDAALVALTGQGSVPPGDLLAVAEALRP